MAFSNGYIFGFATVICVVCSVSVSGVSMALSERQQQNRERDTHNNILSALGLPEEDCDPSGKCTRPKIAGEEIDRLWDTHVEQRFITPSGAPADPSSGDLNGDGELDDQDLTLALDEAKSGKAPAVMGLYVRIDDGQTKSIAIPLDGVGLWGPLSGYLAVNPSGTEVVGATFFAPKETPGLGAEIMEPPFKKLWRGKSIVDASDETEPIRVAKGCTEDPEHCVDAVSGATITSRGVDVMVAQALDWYDPYLSDLRGG